MPNEIHVARVVAATELTKVSVAGVMGADQGTPTVVAERASRIGETFDIIFKAIVKAGG